VELVTQGTLAERIRAAKAGIPAFYPPTGAVTLLAEGKDVREFDGVKARLEYPLKADFALVRAYRRTGGELVYQGSSRNFNEVMAGAATVTIAEVDEIVELGDIDPEAVATPAIYVNRIVSRETAGEED
jgi:3-oxoadipate CoA-transferase alpha subunit